MIFHSSIDWSWIRPPLMPPGKGIQWPACLGTACLEPQLCVWVCERALAFRLLGLGCSQVCVWVTLEWRQCLNSVSASVLKRVCADYECFITATSAFSCELSTKAHWQILFLLAFFTSPLWLSLSLLDGRLLPFSALARFLVLSIFLSAVFPPLSLSLSLMNLQTAGNNCTRGRALVFLFVWKAWQVRLLLWSLRPPFLPSAQRANKISQGLQGQLVSC